jgi:pimeloyl-ACP methyl ester carboxylesterase
VATRQSLPLILLPGLVNDERVWRAVMARLGARAEARVATLRGSDSMAGLAADVLAGAPPRFSLAGLSMGGYCALEIVRQAPERVAALALVDTSARADTPEGRIQREKQIERAGHEYPALIGELLGKWVHPTRVHDADVGEVARDMAVQAGAATFVQQQRAILSRADSRPLLASIRCPTIVIAGADDAVMPPEIHRELADGIAGAQLVSIAGCGHLAPLERPAEVADALGEWLARAA